MLAAFYNNGCISGNLFAGKKIERDDTFEIHLNRHNVIKLDIQNFLFQKSRLDIFIPYYSANAYCLNPVMELPYGKGFADIVYLPKR